MAVIIEVTATYVLIAQQKFTKIRTLENGSLVLEIQFLEQAYRVGFACRTFRKRKASIKVRLSLL